MKAKSEEVIKILYNESAVNRYMAAIDPIFAWIDDCMSAGDFQEVETILDSLDLTKIHRSAFPTILSIAKHGQPHFPRAYVDYYEKVIVRLKELGTEHLSIVRLKQRLAP